MKAGEKRGPPGWWLYTDLLGALALLALGMGVIVFDAKFGLARLAGILLG